MKIVFVLVLAGVAFSAVIKQPIHKVVSLKQSNRMNELVEYKDHPRALQLQTGSGSQPLIEDYEYHVYLGNITLGTPPQTFTVQLDTSSAEFWVVGAECTSEICTEETNSGYKRHQYDRKKSSTVTTKGQQFSVQFGVGSDECDGYTAYDRLSLGGLTYGPQAFGVAAQISASFGTFAMDGVLGLGWPALSANPQIVPPMLNLLPQLDLPLFTVWLDGKAKTDYQSEGGLITYGALDTVHCDEQTNYVTLSSKTYWQFPINGFEFADYSTTKTQQAYTTTGNSAIGLPHAAYNAVVAATGAAFNPLSSYDELPCLGDYPDLVFTIGGNKYNVPANEYILDVGLDNGNCALWVFQLKSGGAFIPDFVLGAPWLRTFCNIHDMGNARIGFSRARHT